jgi:hypothetical protein
MSNPERRAPGSDRCVACGSRLLIRYRARVSPFLAARVGSLAHAHAELVRCRACGLAFFDPRLGDADLAAVYTGYRGVDYQRERQRHEPSYTPELNAALGKGEEEVASRNTNLRDTLARHVDLATLTSVLDYGGDRGQFIPPELAAAHRVVYEISGAEAQGGAVAVSDWAEVSRERYDLVLCNHVLEHVAYPAQVVERLSGVSHPGSWIYVEVPFEWPFRAEPGATWKRRTYLWTLKSQLAANLLFRLLDHTPFVMHEHVNLFDVSSLRALLEGCGLVVAEIGEREIDLGWARARVLSALAHVTPR